MKLWHSILFMIICSFLIQYYVMSYIMTNNINNVTNSLGKFYISVIMGITMGFVEVLMNNMMMKSISWNYYFFLSIALYIFIMLYRNQYGITDKQYLKEMIEHHSMAILTSKEIIQKTNNYNVKKLASDILYGQSNEIDYMKKLVKKDK